jgi:Uma2 family endonuclease
MATIAIPSEQPLRLSGVPWETYLAYSNSLGQRHIRVSYDRGKMEVMTLSSRHERKKTILSRLLEALAEEMDIDFAGFGSMTCRRSDLKRALEPDECYWIEHEMTVRGREDIDLEVDPPPDLALEIEVSRSTMNRMAIYAALRVPEVWRWDGETLRVVLLGARNTYRPSDRSKAFAFLPLEEFRAFLTRTDTSQSELIRSFRAWVRKNKRNWKRNNS